MIRTLFALSPESSRGRIVAHLALTLVSVVLRAAGAVLLVPLVAALFGEHPSQAWPWVGALALAFAAGWAVDWAVSRISFSLGFAVLNHGQREVAERLGRIRLTWFDTDRTATARQAVAATGPELVGVFVYLATPFMSAVLLPIAIAIALLPISPVLGLTAFAGVPVLFGAYWLAGRLSRGADAAADEANTALAERIVEFARTQQALRAARRVEPERSHAGAALDRQHGATMRLLAMQVPGQLVFSLASQLALVLLAGATVALTVRGELSAPEAIALIVVIARYLEPFTALAGLSAAMQGTLGTLRRVGEVLDAPRIDAGSASTVFTAPPRLELRGASFGYSVDAQPVLDGLDLVFEPGTTTAVVGPSGSGKSTILALLAGLQQPTSGAVLVDGIDAAELDEPSRRALTSVVFQHPYLFDSDLRENVLVGDPSAGEQEVAAAAELARVEAIVRELPDGWETRVGEAGRSLSGGERQRVSIARALLKPAPVLLVDEATSALDAENEAAVAAALSGDPRPRTRVIVTHRLSSIRAADRVVFVEAGRVVEEGGIEELLESGGRFAEFWRQQHAASGWCLRG